MTNKLDIHSIMYYGRNYVGCSFSDNESLFFLDLDSLKVYDRETLMRDYHFTNDILCDEMKLVHNYRFAPMFRVNIIENMRFFLNDLNNHRISKEIMALNSEQLYIYFQKYIELNIGDRHRWHEQEKQCLTAAAVDWCKRYHIPYVL